MTPTRTGDPFADLALTLERCDRVVKVVESLIALAAVGDATTCRTLDIITGPLILESNAAVAAYDHASAVLAAEATAGRVDRDTCDAAADLLEASRATMAALPALWHALREAIIGLRFRWCGWQN